jgi:hypothetical protein
MTVSLAVTDHTLLITTYLQVSKFSLDSDGNNDRHDSFKFSQTMSIPLPVLTTLPIPCAILLLLLACYHLTPLLQLIPHLTPRLSKLANIIPNPRRRNLPREFFNLPPRPEDNVDSRGTLSAASVLGVRGKLMLLLIGQTTVSLAAGWTYLMLGTGSEGGVGGIMLALSIVPLPSTILVLAIFTALASASSQRHYSSESRIKLIILKGGGITHDTLLSRSLPISLFLTILVTALAAALPSIASYVVLVAAAASVGTTAMASLLGRILSERQGQIGAIRLRSSSPGGASSQESAVQELREKDMDDWVSSPGELYIDSTSANQADFR